MLNIKRVPLVKFPRGLPRPSGAPSGFCCTENCLQRALCDIVPLGLIYRKFVTPPIEGIDRSLL